MRESKVHSKGRITIPGSVRAALGLEDRDRMRYAKGQSRVRILKVGSVKELRGMLAKPGQRTVSVEEIEDAIANREWL